MALKRFERMMPNILNMVIFIQSPSLEFYIKQQLKDTYQVHKDFVLSAENEKQLATAKLDTVVAPLICDRWLIHVEADEISKKELENSIVKNTGHAITVYWTRKYKTFRQLADNEFVQKASVYNPVFRLTRMEEEDIYYLHNKLVPKAKQLDMKLMGFLYKGYRFDVQSIMQVFSSLNSGREFETKKDIIEYIGVGGNSVSNLTIRLLTGHPKNEKGKNTWVGNIYKLINDLSVTYDYATIKRYMFNTVDAFIEIKELQIMGIYGKIHKEIPEAFDTKRIAMNRRFDRVILNEITLPQLLNLRMCLMKYDHYNAQVALIQALSDYCDSVKTLE